MKRYWPTVILVLSLVADGSSGQKRPSECPVRFEIVLNSKVAPKGAGGRLLVFMSSNHDGGSLSSGFFPDDTKIAAMEAEHLSPGQPFEFDANSAAYPEPFSKVRPGNYRFMALLDQDHDYAYSGQDEDDLYGPVVAVPKFDPARGVPITLELDRTTAPQARLSNSENIQLAEFVSPVLSAFWGRPIVMRAGVVLPAHPDPTVSYPTVYHVHGFGGNYTEAWREGPSLIADMQEGKRNKFIHVFLDGSFPTGHHEFADSVNNGPWGRALTKEFIPWLERKYPAVPSASARFLTGHSSGGWSTLWLQITYPDFFGGTWSTSPDYVDFRAFMGLSAKPGSTDNVYRNGDGGARPLARLRGNRIVTVEQFARHERVEGDYGGQLASFEWVWSPRGPDGTPLPLFDRSTGAQDPLVQKAWTKYDIREVLEENWTALAPKLAGKIHVFCGGEDTFFLEQSTKLLCGFLKTSHSDAVCEIIPGRDHFNLYDSYRAYPNGLEARIDSEMGAKLAPPHQR